MAMVSPRGSRGSRNDAAGGGRCPRQRSDWMAKTKRGKPLRKGEGAQNRGKCPVCNRTGVKMLYETKSADGTVSRTVCKQCKKTVPAGSPAAAAPAEAPAE